MSKGVITLVVILVCAGLLVTALWTRTPSDKPLVEGEVGERKEVEELAIFKSMWDEVVSIRADDEYTILLDYCYGGDLVKISFEADAPINLYVDAPYGIEYRGAPIYATNYARNGTPEIRIPYSGMVIVHFHNPSHLDGRHVGYNLTYVKGAGGAGGLPGELAIPKALEPIFGPILEAMASLIETLSTMTSRYRA